MIDSRSSALALSFCVALASLAPLAAGCDKKDDATPPVPQASATPSASAAPTASGATTASAAPTESASASASAATSASAAPTPSAAHSATAKTTASSDTPAAPKCGTKPLPDCPLQAWMKANANPAVATGDTAKIGESLEKMAKMGPPGYSNWASISLDGAKAAKAGNLDAAKASCRTCHDQYKAKYRAEMRDRKI